jgi:6-phosphogluconolactonase
MIDLTRAEVDVADDPAALGQRAATWLASQLAHGDGVLSVALAGGSTPRPVYRQLAARTDIPWPRIHWFWGDERFVPHDHPDSNYRMARETLLARAAAANIHPVPTDGSPDDAAAAYDETLRRFAGNERAGRPLFDVTLLGIGPDGHTASLFPGGAALAERARWAVAVRDQARTRITLTYPALDNSAHIVFLVAGAEKKPILTRLFAGDGDLPAAHVSPRGTVRFFLDRAAAP